MEETEIPKTFEGQDTRRASWHAWREIHPVDHPAPGPTLETSDPGPSGATAKILETRESVEEKMLGMWELVERIGVCTMVTRKEKEGEKGMVGRAMACLTVERGPGRGAVWFVGFLESLLLDSEVEETNA